MEFETHSTERLLLKKLTPETFTFLFENYPDAEVKKLLGITTDEELRKEKEKSQGGYTTYDRTILSFLLVLKENNTIMGRCGYHNWYNEHQKAELGYHLFQDENKRKGYMTEAVSAILGYGFDTMNLNRIEACTSPENEASIGVLKKHGFTQEGRLRQHYNRNGDIQDSLIFSLLKEEHKK